MKKLFLSLAIVLLSIGGAYASLKNKDWIVPLSYNENAENRLDFRVLL